jgi:hypothetical protein
MKIRMDRPVGDLFGAGRGQRAEHQRARGLSHVGAIESLASVQARWGSEKS